jgi:hypothetical protein
MTPASEITVKVNADTTDALHKIRQIHKAAQTPPVEVLLVSEKTRFWDGLATGQISLWLNAFFGGWTLMLLLPLLSAVGIHMPHPGYWDCVFLVALTRVTLSAVVGHIKPTASKARPS